MEYVIAATGPRGGGKSLEIARLALEFLSNTRDREVIGRVFSNYWIEANMNYESGGQWWNGLLKADLLNTEEMFHFAEQYRNAMAVVDEFQFYADNRRSSSTGNRLINMVGTQLRKRSMTVGITVQNIEWIDLRWRYQVDVQLRCRDLVHTPWGREMGLKRGEEIIVQAYDMTGVITGYGVWDTKIAEPYKQTKVNGKAMWDRFDTNALVGQEEIFRSYEVQKQKIAVNQWGTTIQSEADTYDYNNQPVPLGEVVESALVQMAQAGFRTTTAREVGEILSENGFVYPTQAIGKAMGRCPGIGKYGSQGLMKYNLEGVLGCYE